MMAVRKWRKKKALGGTGAWDVEVGEDNLPAQVRGFGYATICSTLS